VPDSKRITNAVLDEKITSMQGYLSDIHKEVKATNGRVTKLELWRAYMTGAVAALASITTIIAVFQFVVN
jgi:hypothetical protein